MFLSKRKKAVVVCLSAMLAVVMSFGGFGSAVVLADVGFNPTVVLADGGGPRVHVSGAGAITVAPDMATITLGVNTQEATPQEAISKNNAAIADVLAAMERLGIDEEDVRTLHFFLHQAMDFDFATGRAVPMGYNVTNSVQVVVRDLDKVGDVIAAGVAAGANVSAGVQFGLSDPAPLYYQALALAMNDARNKANAIARSLGMTVGEVSSVMESNMWMVPVAGVPMMDMGMGWGSPMAMVAQGGMSGGVPIAPGDLTVTARVEIVYILVR